MEDRREVGAAVRQCGFALDGHQVWRQPLVHQNVGAQGGGLQPRRDGRVAADHHAPALVDEQIAHGRLDRMVVHREGVDLQVGFGDQRHVGAVAADGEGPWLAAKPRGRQDLGAVVGDAVTPIQGVGLFEPGHHLFDAGRSIDRHGRCRRAASPTLQHQFAQVGDMVGVVVGQEDRADPRRRQVHQRQVLGAAGPGIDHEQALAGDDDSAGSGARRIGHGRAGAAQADMQTVGQFGDRITAHGPVEHPRHDVLGKGAAHQPDPRAQHDQDHDQRQTYRSPAAHRPTPPLDPSVIL